MGEVKILKLTDASDPILSEKCVPYIFEQKSIEDPTHPWNLVELLVRTMRHHQGIGLAANQVGMPIRLFVIAGEPEIAFFNPLVVDQSKNEIVMEEGCLTYPGLFVKIKRPAEVRVRYQDADGHFHTEKFIGASARTIQHEIGHLNGEVFYHQANRYYRERSLRQWELRKRK